MIRARQRFEAARSEGGFTLVELLAYIIILAIVMGIGASIFIQIIQNQNNVKAIAETNNTAQLLAKQIEDDLRSAQWAEAKHGGTLMVAKSRSATSSDVTTVRCVAYFFDSTTDTLYRSASGGLTVTRAALAAANESQVRALARTWPQSYPEITRIDGARMFGIKDEKVTTTKRMTVDFRALTVDGRPPVDFSKAVTLRPQADISQECT